MLLKKVLRGFIIATATAVCYTSCSQDEPEPVPDNDGTTVIDPATPVADPEGTISLSMNNKANGDTRLGRIGIGADNNFYAADWYNSQLWFADLGAMAGLGNVTSIPKSGWASQLQVIPGHGYVAYRRSVSYYNGVTTYSDEEIYRIYVVDYISGTSGGIIGADIKYQTPFNGKETAVTLDKTSLDVSKENRVNITNKSFISFDIKVEGNFLCDRIVDKNAPFITTALNIGPNGIPSSAGEKGKIILTASNGKVTELPISYGAAEAYINLEKETVTFDCHGAGSKPITIGFDTNVDGGEVQIACDADWIKADATAFSELGYGHNGIINIYTSTNCSSILRSADIKVTKGSVTKTIKITQDGFQFAPEFPDIITLYLDKPDSTYGGLRYYTISPYGENSNLLKDSYIKFEQGYVTVATAVNWIQQVNYKNTYFELVCNTGYKTGTEETTIDILYNQQGTPFDDILIKSIVIRWE